MEAIAAGTRHAPRLAPDQRFQPVQQVVHGRLSGPRSPGRGRRRPRPRRARWPGPGPRARWAGSAGRRRRSRGWRAASAPWSGWRRGSCRRGRRRRPGGGSPRAACTRGRLCSARRLDLWYSDRPVSAPSEDTNTRRRTCARSASATTCRVPSTFTLSKVRSGGVSSSIPAMWTMASQPRALPLTSAADATLPRAPPRRCGQRRTPRSP